MGNSRYQATGVEVEFHPGSRGRVLRNLLGIARVRDMNLAESQALEIAQDLALDRFDADHRFTAADICDLHALWLGPIYPWAGEYRSVDIGKGGFQFAHARLVPGLMAELERDFISIRTKMGLRARRAAGVILGKPVGTKQPSVLDRHLSLITDMRANRASVGRIAATCGVSRTTMVHYINTRSL